MPSTSLPKQPNRQAQYPKIQYYFLLRLRGLLCALGEFIRHPSSSVTTLLVIAIAMTLPTGLLLFLKNIESIGQAWHGNPSISLYVDPQTSVQQLQIIKAKLSTLPGVANLQYISPEQGLSELIESSQFKNVLAELPNNPLPSVFVVTPIFNEGNALALNRLLQQLQSINGITQGELDATWLKRLYYIVMIGERLSYTLAFLFALGVVLIIGNTIRLTTEKHHDEINVMKLLGAKDSFIKRPLHYRGVLYGFLGSALSWMIINVLIAEIEKPTSVLVESYQSTFHLQHLPFLGGLLLILIGSLLGFLGAYFSVHRQLKQPEFL